MDRLPAVRAHKYVSGLAHLQHAVAHAKRGRHELIRDARIDGRVIALVLANARGHELAHQLGQVLFVCDVLHTHFLSPLTHPRHTCIVAAMILRVS